MYAVNLEELRRWLSIKNRAFRFWTREWIDSLHVGTHIHWQLSPLSVLNLAFLWQFIERQESRYTARQRVSLKAMARRRHNGPGFVTSMPAFEDKETAWSAFFSRQIAAKDQIHAALVDWHLTKLAGCTNMVALCGPMSNLFASLLLKGFTTDQLFRAVCKTVLDPLGMRETSVEQNLLALFSSFANPPATEFFAYTKLVRVSTDQVSKTLLRKWSKRTLSSVEKFDSIETQAVLIGDSLDPYIITRRRVIGGIGELHRREAHNVYSLRVRQHPELSLFRLPARSYFKGTALGAEEQYYDVNFKRTAPSLVSSGDDAGAVLFQKATNELFDAPEDAIRNLIVATDIRWRRPSVRDTDCVLADAYRWSLRTRLGEDLANYLARVRSMNKDLPIPAGCVITQIGAWNWEKRKGFSSLEAQLEEMQDPDDELVLFRLREINHWYSTKVVTVRSRPC